MSATSHAKLHCVGGGGGGGGDFFLAYEDSGEGSKFSFPACFFFFF